MSLTEKKLRFADEYLIDLNGTQAAIRAGYSPRTANEQAARLLANASVQQAIAERIRAREARTHVEQDRILLELSRIALFDIRKLYDKDGALIPIRLLDDDTAAAVSGLDILEEFENGEDGKKMIGYTKKFKLSSKTDAINMAMRHLGAFRDKLDVNLTSDIGGRLNKAKQRLNGNN